MTVAWNAAPGTHAVQFYEGERFLHGAISRFFANGLETGEPLVMICRRRTFDGVVERLAAEYGLTPGDTAARIRFVDVDEALRSFMEGITPNPSRFEQGFAELMASIPRRGANDTVWIYGEMVDVLCREGNHAAAVQLEELWNAVSAGWRVSVICGYAMEDFDDDMSATQLRGVCRQHTHVIPAEGFTDAPDDRARFEQVALLQQRARALDRALARERPPLAAPQPAIAAATVYVIDDDASVRRSLARLLASIDLPVRTFDSAEAFLTDVADSSSGCLIVDVQLVGMSGPDLLARMTSAHWTMPIIAMSGSHDPQVEAEALRLGAVGFLRKPFDAEALIDSITRALS
jgi:CheY-like chemotaxis protein